MPKKVEINIWQLRYAINVAYNPDNAIDEEGVAKDMALKGFMVELEKYVKSNIERAKGGKTQVVCSICLPYVNSEVIISQERYIDLLQERIDYLSKPWWKNLWN